MTSPLLVSTTTSTEQLKLSVPFRRCITAPMPSPFTSDTPHGAPAAVGGSSSHCDAPVSAS
jgi:hypothetical protein